MTIIKKAVAAVSLACLFSLPAHAGDYHRHSGISINIGSQYDGISLSYRTPKQYKHHTKRYKYKASHNGISLNYRTPKHYKDNKKYYKPKASHHQHAKHYKTNPYSHHKYTKQYRKPYSQYKHHDKYVPKQYQQVKIISQSCHPVSQRVVNRYGYYETVITKQCYDRVVQVPSGRYTRH